MKISRGLRQKANAIVAKYCGWHYPNEIPAMYEELNQLGISVPCFGPYQFSHPYEINGEEVENSSFFYDVYKPNSGSRYDFTMYFS